MDVAAALLEEHSKAQTLKLADWAASDERRFAELMALMLGGDQKLSRRTAWVIGHCLEAAPGLAAPYLEEMIGLLETDVHDALKRCVLRSFAYVEMPRDIHGRLLKAAFDLLMDRKASVAIRVFAMSVIERLSETYPVIKRELSDYLEIEMEFGSAGFQSRARKILKRIHA